MNKDKDQLPALEVEHSNVEGQQPTPDQAGIPGKKPGGPLSEEDVKKLNEQLEKRLGTFRNHVAAAAKHANHIYVQAKSFELDGVEFDAFKCVCSMAELLAIVDGQRPIEGSTMAKMFHAVDENIFFELQKQVKKREPVLGDIKALLEESVLMGVEMFMSHETAPGQLKPEFNYVIHESNSVRYALLFEVLNRKS